MLSLAFMACTARSFATFDLQKKVAVCARPDAPNVQYVTMAYSAPEAGCALACIPVFSTPFLPTIKVLHAVYPPLRICGLSKGHRSLQLRPPSYSMSF